MILRGHVAIGWQGAWITYDLAVWEGERPADAEAGGVFKRLYQRYIDLQSEIPATPAISGYVSALLARWIDMTDDEHDISPWSGGPLINNARGPIIYFAMRYSMASDVSAAAARMAADRGLVCFRPQWSCLGPAAEER